MSEDDRLRLIAQAVRYCRNAKEAGMPSLILSKTLREAVHFLWERRIGAAPNRLCGRKLCAARFRSRAAKGLRFGNRQLAYDHAIPFHRLERRLMNDSTDLSPVYLKLTLDALCYPTLVTTQEHNEKLEPHMPDGWKEGDDPYARYKAAGIVLEKNEFYPN